MKNYSKVFRIFILIISISFLQCSEDNSSADLILFNGKIVTMDESNPTVEAIAIVADTIVALGSSEEIKKWIGTNTKQIDLKGKLATPGLIESHAHFEGLGASKIKLDLSQADNWDEIIAMVAAAAEKAGPGTWIVGRGWHQEKWNPIPTPNVNGYPLHNDLSRATPYNPVLLGHASGHALYANKKAMDMAGVNKKTVDIGGGKIVRDKNNNPIGVFEENAEEFIYKIYSKDLSKRTEEEVKADYHNKVQLAVDECLKNGITTFHDAGTSFKKIDMLKELVDSNKIGIRLYTMLGESNKNLAAKMVEYKMIGYGNNHLTVRAIKKYMDGALGSRGAWFLDPYTDLPTTSGANVISISELNETAALAIKNGYQLCTHAIGDKGNREVLNSYKNAYRDSKDLRWRIEHAQHLSLKDIPRFAEIGVIASMQGIHCTSDAPYVEKRLGKQRASEGAYVWKKLIDSGALICNGTDAPIEKVSPIKNYYASVTRKLNDGTTFYPTQKMTREEALKTYTINAAFAGFEEDIKGSLTIGKLADITVYSRDILTIPDVQIPNTKIIYTIVGGKVLYEDK